MTTWTKINPTTTSWTKVINIYKLLCESGAALLQESGFVILLESTPSPDWIKQTATPTTWTKQTAN